MTRKMFQQELKTYGKLTLIVTGLALAVILVKRPNIFFSKASNKSAAVSPTPRLEVDRNVPRIETKTDLENTLKGLDTVDPSSIQILLDENSAALGK